jgi:hypothetical protein
VKTTVLCMAALFGGVACDLALGIETFPGSVFQEPDCATCMDDACREQVDACFLVEDCLDFVACQGRCGPDDFLCRAECDLTEPSGSVNVAARDVDACRRAACRGECIGASLPATYPGADCDACVLSTPECRAAREACLADADCERLTLCFSAVDDPPSTLQCLDEYTSLGSATLEAWDDCARLTCRDACGVGTHWDCVGAWSEVPVGTGSPIELTIEARALFENDVPLANVTVEVCQQFVSDPTGCAPIPERTVVTDEAGLATVSVPSTSGEGFVSHLRLSRPAAEDMAEVELNLFKLSAPIARPMFLTVLLLRSFEVGVAGAAACDPAVPAPEPMHGAVGLFARDCLLDNGVRATVAVLDADGSECTSPDCGVEPGVTAPCYLNGGDPWTGISTGTGVINLLPGLRDLQLSVAGAPVATLRGVPVVARTHTHLIFFPDRE